MIVSSFACNKGDSSRMAILQEISKNLENNKSSLKRK